MSRWSAGFGAGLGAAAGAAASYYGSRYAQRSGLVYYTGQTRQIVLGVGTVLGAAIGGAIGAGSSEPKQLGVSGAEELYLGSNGAFP